MYFYVVILPHALLKSFHVTSHFSCFPHPYPCVRGTNSIFKLHVCGFWSWKSFEVRIWVCVLTMLSFVLWFPPPLQTKQLIARCHDLICRILLNLTYIISFSLCLKLNIVQKNETFFLKLSSTLFLPKRFPVWIGRECDSPVCSVSWFTSSCPSKTFG
jgi:hypothetical protein